MSKIKSNSDEKPPRLITFAQLKQHGVHLGRHQIDRLEAENKFPKRVPLSAWRVAWVTEEIDAWVSEKIAARSTEIGVLGAGKKRSPKRTSVQS